MSLVVLEICRAKHNPQFKYYRLSYGIVANDSKQQNIQQHSHKHAVRFRSTNRNNNNSDTFLVQQTWSISTWTRKTHCTIRRLPKKKWKCAVK